jgi:succinate dehydrogenase/fumarate reductase flavoprotein subunit
MALEAGATLLDMEMVQFYPECLVHPDSIRGFGLGSAEYAKLFNSEGERFLGKLDPVNYERGKTRDVMSRAIYREIQAGMGSEHGGVYMDAIEVSREQALSLTHEYELCLDNGIDLTRDRAEVAPGAHYFMGGAKIDEACHTTVPGLYAAGEVTGGVHGANRLSGNSLADILVFGARAGMYAAEEALGSSHIPRLDSLAAQELEGEARAFLGRRGDGMRPASIKDALRAVMWDRVSVVRSEPSLEEALREIAALKEEHAHSAGMGGGGVHNRELLEYLEAGHMLLVAETIARCALMRKESRGAHFLEEYPQRRDDEWLRHTSITVNDGKLEFSNEPVRLIETAVEAS